MNSRRVEYGYFMIFLPMRCGEIGGLNTVPGPHGAAPRD